MQRLFDEARLKRRTREYVLTSTFTNATNYGSPAWAKKKSIWPPLSDHGAATGPDTTGLSFSVHQTPTTLLPATATRNSSTIAKAPDSAIRGQYTSDTSVLYHALHSGSVIRVLEIEAGSFADPVICKFHYADLDSLHIHYDALSYVWNKPLFRWNDEDMRKAKVCCQGHEVRVSENLEQAIRHIRSTKKPALLWADALCINQDDAAERGHQVTLMASIYRRAQRTIIWLGNETGSEFQVDPEPPELEHIRAERAFGAICDIVNRWLSIRAPSPGETGAASSYQVSNPDYDAETRRFDHFQECPFSLKNSVNQAGLRKAMQRHGLFNSGEDLNDWDELQMQLTDLGVDDDFNPHSEPASTRKKEADPGLDADERSAPRSPLWASVASLFSRPWFWRIWVIQEAVLAQSAVVKWGRAEMDWKWIGLASAILRTNYNPICEAMKMSGVYNAYFMFRLSPMSDLPPLRLSFTQLLRLTRQFEVTDVRDRVYGLLGIRTTDNDPDAGSLFVQPDYSISYCELWKRLATKVIHESRNLSLLSSVQYTTEGFEAGIDGDGSYYLSVLSDDRFPPRPLPSWVPHWDIVYRATLAPWDHDDRFAAAKGFPLHLDSPAGDADNLVVEGIQIGVVGRCCRYMWHEADTALLQSKVMGSFFASEDGLSLLARTLTAGRNAYGSLAGLVGGDSCLADLAAYILDCDRNQRDGRYRGRPPFGDENWMPIRTKSGKTAFQRQPDLEERLERLAVDGDASRFCSSVVPVCERRRLFITLNGYLGLGCDSVLEGDIVCVLSGADLPFVLRPVRIKKDKTEANIEPPSNEISPIDHYVVVGECYVEGLMNGEAVAAVAGDSAEFSGPVPQQLIEEDILSTANEPEKVITQGLVAEIERTKMKQARLDAGDLFTPEILAAARRNNTVKRWFDIH